MSNARGATTEGPVSALWNWVLSRLFLFPASPDRSYWVEIKSAALASNHEPDVLVIEVRFTNNSTTTRQRQIFIAELKSSREDTTRGWESAETQLGEYLHENINGANRLYAAVGIGTKVVFFKWDRSQGPPVRYMDEMTPMHQGALDFDRAPDRRAIEGFLEQIKEDGWDRSLS